MTGRATSSWRYLVLAALFAVAALAVSVLNAAPAVDPTPRFPSDDATFVVSGWTVAPAHVEGRGDTAFVTREYRRADGTTAEVGITTAPYPKTVYRADPDVPFLGSGYTVEAAPADLPLRPGWQTLVARRGDDTWLQIAMYGEQRGTLGNQTVAWAFAIFDTLLGRENDYYLVRVLVPYSPARPSVATAADLADSVFPRIAAWYAR